MEALSSRRAVRRRAPGEGGMGELDEELLNVYDGDGRVVGTRRRAEAKASGLAVGAVNALLVNARGEILLQRRPMDKENGGAWDKSVGGHVDAGEEFDATLLREAGEELFDDGRCGRVILAGSDAEFRDRVAREDLARSVLLRRVALQTNLRDVRRGPDGRRRIVVYHVAVYAGRTDVPLEGFRPQPSEIQELRYFPADEVDRMFLSGELAPNMAFLWLTQGLALLALVAR
jgi:8-oxo-dGTP pyrophosphatase MutT (NUDIX family)